MNKEEITYKIPNNQIHISEIKDEDCLIWISPKALNMANTIDELQQENQKYKEVIDKINLVIKGIAYGGNEDYYIENFSKINELLKAINKQIEELGWNNE